MSQQKHKDYELERTVLDLKGTLAVTIPIWLAKNHDIKAGDKVRLRFNSYPGILITKEILNTWTAKKSAKSRKHRKVKKRARKHGIEHKTSPGMETTEEKERVTSETT
jgi:hypothetical protein